MRPALSYCVVYEDPRTASRKHTVKAMNSDIQFRRMRCLLRGDQICLPLLPTILRMPVALHGCGGLQFDLGRDNATIERHRRLLESTSFDILINSCLDQHLDLLRDLVAFHYRVRRQDSLNIAKPSREFAIPIDRRFERGLELRPLLPAQLVQLGAIDRIAAVIELPVMRMLDPSFHVRQSEQAEELLRELHVRDLILRVDIVGLSDLALVQDGIEGFRCVAGVKVASGVLSVAVEQQWLPTTEEVDELWYDLCAVLACWRLRSIALLTFRVLEDLSAGDVAIGASCDVTHT